MIEFSNEETKEAFIRMQAELNETRGKLAVAVEALEKIIVFGDKAHSIWTKDAHSFNLGLSMGTAILALSKIRVGNK